MGKNLTKREKKKRSKNSNYITRKRKLKHSRLTKKQPSVKEKEMNNVVSQLVLSLGLIDTSDKHINVRILNNKNKRLSKKISQVIENELLGNNGKRGNKGIKK
jgi:hypothetical protein